MLVLRGVCTQVLSGFIAGAAALTLSSQAEAATPVDLFDDRKARSTGFDLIYEARDLDLPQNVRDGLTQARQGLEATKARVKASESRIDTELEPFIVKNYWQAILDGLDGPGDPPGRMVQGEGRISPPGARQRWADGGPMRRRRWA